MDSSVSLYDSYLCKETRAKKQHQLVKKHANPIITIKAHIPKELRNNLYVKEIIKHAIYAIKHMLNQQNFLCVATDEHKGNAGEEHYFSVQCRSASELKKYTMIIENTHPLGQLMDLNVMNKNGETISRGSCDLDARQCIICNSIAPECAKKHRHTLSELDNKIKSVLEEFQTVA